MRVTSLRQRFAPALILLVLISGMLSACGGGGSSAQPTAGAGGQPTAMAAPTGAAGEQPTTAAGEQPTTAAGEQPTAMTEPTTAAGAGATGGGACPAAAQGQQLTLWSPLTGPDGNFMTQLAAQFSQESGIKVTHLPQPDYLQKLNAAAAGQKLPDMTVIRADDIAEMAARGVIKPIGNDAMAVIGDLSGDFPQQVWAIGEYKSQRYTIPLDVHPLVLYYNKDMFQKAGITMPTDRPMTREEFEAAAAALNKDGVAGVALGSGFQGGTIFWMLLRQFGGQVVSDDGQKAAYNSEAGVKALTYLRDMRQKYSPQISGAGDPEVKLFQQGKAGMVMHGPWHISDMEKLPFVGFAQVPQIGEKYAVWGGSHQLSMTTDDPTKQAAAACWISWLSKNSAQWAKAGLVPVRQSVRSGPDLATASPAVAAFAKEADDVIMPQPIPGLVTAVWGEGFGKAVDAVLLGQQADVKKALDDSAAKTDQLLQQNRQRYSGE